MLFICTKKPKIFKYENLLEKNYPNFDTRFLDSIGFDNCFFCNILTIVFARRKFYQMIHSSFALKFQNTRSKNIEICNDTKVKGRTI